MKNRHAVVERNSPRELRTKLRQIRHDRLSLARSLERAWRQYQAVEKKVKRDLEVLGVHEQAVNEELEKHR